MAYQVQFETIPENDIQGLCSNVESCFARQLPKLADLPDFGKRTGPAAIVAGGPSLNSELENLIKFQNNGGTIFSCGSVHDYLIQNEIFPDFHVVYDPHLTVLKYLSKPDPHIIYLVTSQAVPAIFEILINHNCRVYPWHAMALDGSDSIDFHGEPTIPGGDGTVLRAWPLAAVIGFREFHFFGFDCSFPLECTGRHAYHYDIPNGETVSVTTDTGKKYFSTVWMLNQLDYFVKSLLTTSNQCKVFIHGESLVAETCRGK